MSCSTCRWIIKLDVSYHDDEETEDDEDNLPVGGQTGNMLTPKQQRKCMCNKRFAFETQIMLQCLQTVLIY